MMKIKKYHKVKDHCHYTGKYRGAAYDICNLRYKIPKEIPAVFHNGSTFRCLINGEGWGGLRGGGGRLLIFRFFSDLAELIRTPPPPPPPLY